MRIRFISTAVLGEYHSLDGDRRLSFHNGTEDDVSEEKAGQVLQDFPDNFAVVLTTSEAKAEIRALTESPMNKMIDEPIAKRGPGRPRRV